MFSMAIGCYGEDTIPCVWVRRPLRAGGPALIRNGHRGLGKLCWQPAWHYYSDPDLSNYKQLRF